ncbi:hypothetical protein N657DRAFT_624458 [Parathielavia appendiculata]|uniref:Uncharacterized protein n=1 Tax=Parathielavia appendiculata TaxID=2587402 RepID=A0AAN6TV95_9PEZI|nr:hypothetical protein N657DRAFT_624458 [Parathielavia appendiculata]
MEEERTITLDLGSSPDPLIDPVLSPPMMPPSHIKKKSQAAERLFTVLAPSPRKQTFELDVGNEGSPQRLLVTVEAGDEGTRNTSRRLFQSPTPKRRATPRRGTAVTTTTVPLRGLSDDEAAGSSNGTPRRRGRPRKLGTPKPTRRKRPGTPVRGRKDAPGASLFPQKDILTSDLEFETNPRPSSQPRRVAKRKATSPASEDGPPSSQPRKRGRPRKQTTTDGDTTRLGQEDTPNPEGGTHGSFAPHQADQRGRGMEDDIWLATLSDQPTPVARGQQRSYDADYTVRDRRASEPEPQLPQHDPGDQPQYDWPDLGGGADSYSDAGSMTSEQHSDNDVENTVMAEGFTLISIGSLPSMQPNSSVMAPAHEELGEATSMIINGALESLRQSQNRSTEQTGGKPAPVAVAAQPTGDQLPEHSAQPKQKPALPPLSPPQNRRQSPRRAKAQPLARRLAEKSLQQGERQSPALPQPPVTAEPQEASTYDDSFSEIPEVVLAAATPRRYRRPQPESEEPDEDIQPSIERPSRVNYSNPQSETNRLLTPDETPSPIQSDAENHNPQSSPPRPAPNAGSPSSRPIESLVQPSDAITQHIRRNSTETPADQLSSFTSANMGGRDIPPVHLPAPEPQSRPSLSPIVRAGRALQIITSDPPSPPGRDSVLRSPFRGSFPKSSQSPATVAPHAPPDREMRSPSQPRVGAVVQSPSRSWLAPLSQVKDFIVRSAQSLSPARVSVSGTERMDDPFGPDPGELTGSVSGEGSPGAGSQRSVSPDLGAFNASRPSDDDHIDAQEEPADPAALSEPPEARLHMDQVQQADPFGEERGAEEEEEDEDIWMAIGAPTPYAPRNAPARLEPLPGSARRSKIPSPWRQNNRRLIYNDELERHSEQNSHSQRGSPATEKEEPRRQAQARVRQVTVRPGRKAPTNEEEEYSLLSQDPPGQRLAPSNPPTKKPDLSAFFSSPAVLPDMEQLTGLVSSKELSSRARGVPKTRAMPVERPTSFGNSLFAQYLQPQSQTQLPPIPQKQLDIGSHRRSVDLFSPVRKVVERISPKQPASSTARSNLSSQPAEETRPGNIPQQMHFLPPQRQVSDTKTAAAAASAPRTASPGTDEIRPPTIPQKMNFTPLRRPSHSTLLQPKPVAPTSALFGNREVSDFFSRSRPHHQRPGARPREEQDEAEGSSLMERPLKPLPDRAASPGKSCIRSPLKPKTPGRMVEFTSSTLSPLAQAQARAERRASMSPERQDEHRPHPGRGQVTNNGMSVDKNYHAASSEHSPSPSPSPSHEQQQQPQPQRLSSHRLTSSTTASIPPEPQQQNQQQQQQQQQLSPTTWTRAHWLRLDELLQARRSGILQFQLEVARRRPLPFATPGAGTTTTTTRRRRRSCRQLLGKIVTSQGESMALEEWHLDVVEAFLAEVGATTGGGGDGGNAGQMLWDGTQIAKRVFALLVGEERRRVGMVPARW